MRHKMTCQIFFSENFRCLDEFFIVRQNTTLVHLPLRYRSDNLSIHNIEGRRSPIKNMRCGPTSALPPVKPGLPALCTLWLCGKNIRISTADIELFFNCRRSVIAPGNNCRNNMCQSPWGALHPALHKLRGYGWLKLYGMERGGGHRCFSKAKGPLLLLLCMCCIVE